MRRRDPHGCARDVVERAERVFENVPRAAYDVAHLALTKASALRMLRSRDTEAASLARNAA